MQLNTEVVDGVGVIRVRGEVDCLEAPTLDAAAAQLLGNGARSLVIDCRDVGYIDSAGLQVLVGAYNRAHAQGGTVTVRQPSRFTYRLLRAVGLDTVLEVEGVPDPAPDVQRTGRETT